MRKIISAEQKLLDAFSIGWSLAHDLDALQNGWLRTLEARQQRHHHHGEVTRLVVLRAMWTPQHQRPDGVDVLHGSLNNSLPNIVGRNRGSVKAKAGKGNQRGQSRAVVAMVTCEEGLMTTRPRLQ